MILINTIGSIDDLIENNQKLIDKIMRYMKLKVINNKDIKSDELGKFIDIYDNQRKPLSSLQRNTENKLYPYYGATSILDYVDSYIFDGNYLLIAEDGSVINNDNTPVLQLISGKSWVGNHAHIVKGKILNNYSLYFILSTTNIKENITGAVQMKINQENLKKIKIKIPADILSFNELSDKMGKQIEVCNSNIQLLNKIKSIYLKKFFD